MTRVGSGTEFDSGGRGRKEGGLDLRSGEAENQGVGQLWIEKTRKTDLRAAQISMFKGCGAGRKKIRLPRLPVMWPESTRLYRSNNPQIPVASPDKFISRSV